jgi:WD40 repeat protein/DNA-binding SARP family transcriptional activator/KaiC/GvpD/RAD55 family RecA-like ATPase
LEVTGAPASHQLRGRRERAVLTALVLAAGDVVGTERLIAALWNGSPPRSAAKNVQNCVLRLRKALGSDVIETRPPGYRLVVPADAIDARRFEDLVVVGRAARVNGTPDRAVAALRQALALWRGPPLEDLRGWDPADGEATRLSELRRVAAEELMDAELACGNHASCVADLERMAGEEPFRERRWALLMLALYRVGRQADALRTYQRARTALGTELGIEPGPELRALERAIVAQDPSLDLPAPPVEQQRRTAEPPGETAGVVFILFTDTVASTEVLDRLGDEATDELRRAQFRELRAAVAAHAGQEVKGVGDGLMVTFTSGADAVACAIEMQRAVAAANRDAPEPLAVRVGLHVGEPVRDDGDLYGASVVIASRLCETAAPGQILASDLVRELVAPRRRFEFAEAGSIALKGLADPVAAVEVVGDSTDAAAAPRAGAQPPYKGLMPFEPEDSALFFGRDATVAALIDRLGGQRLVVVVGASGTGKSSLVRAGVLASLREDALPGSSAWPTVLMTPGAHPMAELAAQLPRRVGVSASALLDELDGDVRTLDLAARQAVADLPRGTRAIVVIDQFEELFTLCRDEAERHRFVDLLVHAATVAGGATTVLLAVRADFYGHCGAHPELARIIGAGTTLLSPMTPDEMATAIDAPARVAGLRLEPGLSDVVLRDLAAEPGALPLLSHALLETWMRRRGRTLTHDGYREAGGVRGAIANTAESVYGRLDTSEQALAHQVVVRLTELGEGTEDTRRRVTVAELSTAADGAGRLAALLRTLVDARLVTTSEAGVELAHEALIREWPRLRDWLEDDREGLRIHRHLTHAAQDWAALGRDPAELYRGPRLAGAVEWAGAKHGALLNPLEREFLDASTTRQQHEAREQAAQVRRLRRLLAGVGIALVLALVAGSLAIVQQRRAHDQADAARVATLRADVGRLVAESSNQSDRDRYLSTLLALEAHRLADTPATRGALLNALVAEPRLQATWSAGHTGYSAASYVPPGDLLVVGGPGFLDFFDTRTGRLSGPSIDYERGAGFAVSHDGSLLATGSGDGTVTLWDVVTRERHGRDIKLGHDASGLAFSPDGRLLVTSEGVYADTAPMDTSESVRVWDIATRTPVDLPLSGHASSVNAVAFSPEGDVFATGGNDGTVVLHDASTGGTVGVPLSVGSSGRYVKSVAFGRGGNVLGVGTQGGDSLVFDVATGAQLASLPGAGLLSTVFFSPDGRQIAVSRGVVQVFDAATFEPVGAPIDPQLGGGTVGAFSPDGRSLAIAGAAGIVGLWDLDGHALIARPIPGSAPVGGVFSPDGTVVATLDSERVTVYDAATLDPVGRPLPVPPGSPVHATALPGRVAFSHDGKVLAVSGRDRTIQRYDVRTLESLGNPIVVDSPPFSLAFSPDDRLLAVGSSEDRVTLVDTERATVSPAHRLGRAGFVGVTFRPDGRQLVATNAIGGASMLDLTAAEPVPERIPGTDAEVSVVAFSADGRLAATGGLHGTIQFRDPRTFEPLGAPVTVGSGVVLTLAFSPDSRLLVGVDLTNRARLIDVATRQPVGDPLPAVPVDLSFSPDSTLLALPATSTTALWDLDPAAWRQRACEIAGRNLTPAEMREYLPDDPDPAPTCPRYPG